MDEGPELFVALGGEVGVVQLMRRAIEAEAHQAQGADDEAVDFIEQPAFAQQSVRRLVKADQHAVHEVAGDQDAAARRASNCRDTRRSPATTCVRKNSTTSNRKCRAADPMRLVRFDLEVSAVGVAFIVVRVVRAAMRGFGRAAGTGEHSLEHAPKVFHLRLRKEFRSEEPHDFELFAVLGDFAREVKARGAGRAHPQFRRQAGQHDVGHRMVLQRETHVENRIVPRRSRDRRARGRVRRRASRSRSNRRVDLMQRAQRWRRNERSRLDPTAQRHDPGEVAHRFVDRLLVAVRDRRADEDVVRAGPVSKA